MSYPPVGSPVLVLALSPDDGSLTVYRGHVSKDAIQQHARPAAFWCVLEGLDGESFIRLEDEGVEWARGDDAETEHALLAAHALRNETWAPPATDRAEKALEKLEHTTAKGLTMIDLELARTEGGS